jgi:hypothetical protein
MTRTRRQRRQDERAAKQRTRQEIRDYNDARKREFIANKAREYQAELQAQAREVHSTKPVGWVERRRERQAQILCPHCQTRGQVTTRWRTRHTGLLGLIKSKNVNEMRCGNCGMKWSVDR